MSHRQPPSRRQVKVARVLRDSISDAITNHLSDPRIEGLISVTEVDVSPDLRNADVSLSIMAPDEAMRRRTMQAIIHATRHIQTLVGRQITSRFCPHLHFHEDENLRRTLETLNLIEKVSAEWQTQPGESPAETPDP